MLLEDEVTELHELSTSLHSIARVLYEFAEGEDELVTRRRC